MDLDGVWKPHGKPSAQGIAVRSAGGNVLFAIFVEFMVCACMYIVYRSSHGTMLNEKRPLQSHTIVLFHKRFCLSCFFICIGCQHRIHPLYIRFFHCCFLSVAALNWYHSHEIIIHTKILLEHFVKSIQLPAKIKRFICIVLILRYTRQSNQSNISNTTKRDSFKFIQK